MGIKAEDYIEDIPSSELLDEFKKGLETFNSIYKEGDFKEILSSLIVLLDTVPMMPYGESIFFSIQQQIQERYNLQGGVDDLDEDTITEDDKKQIKEWMNFIMIALAGLASKLDTIDDLIGSDEGNPDISDEMKEQIEKLGKDNLYQA